MGKKYGQLAHTVDFFAKLAGMLTDHCAKEKKDVMPVLEQKKIDAMYQKLGEDVVHDSSNAELLPKFLGSYSRMIKDFGGQDKWGTLAEDEQKGRIMTEEIVIDLGKEAYEMLSDTEKRTLKLFIWAGCGCHKDLNTVKAGYVEMATWWEEHKITGPVLLANRDNAAVLKEVPTEEDEMTPAQRHAFDVTSKGGVKATQIAGAIFNHKDDKKGHQNIFCFWWQKHTDIEFTFPDTSNTHFQSHCEAAGVLLLHYQSIIEYLTFSKNNKQNGCFNHMEKNLWNALHCTATLTELAVLALYGQSISHPYMAKIRSGQKNMLDMGPFHEKVHKHMMDIIRRPEILIGNDVSHETGALDGFLWNSPDVITAIHDMKSKLPHLKGLLVTFFKGAVKGWKRFTSEFIPGGLIDEATMEEKDLAWLPTTNDVNEGALGSFRVLIRKQPQLTVLHYNAQALFHHNETQAFMSEKFGTEDDYKFLHQEARKMQGVDKKRKHEIIEHAEARVAQKLETKKVNQAKKEKNAAKIASIELIMDREAVVKLTGEKLRDHFSAFKAAGAPNMIKIVGMHQW